MYISKKMK